MTALHTKSCSKPGGAPVSLSLPIAGEVAADGTPIKKHAHTRPQSTMGKWRAGLLIAVHAAIAAHIVQWLISGMNDGVRNTLSPIEPSESMFTLETGRLNAGFIMFSVAILATALFGRFFCGWLCHVVALQDACGWIMKKFGIHPKPWRSRLLVWVPLVLGLYMFVWPTFRRMVLQPAAEKLWGGVPVWMGESLPLRGFTNHFIVEDFWATFAPWYMAIPFLLVCGFVVVYFLGAKAFCTYGCPYGGIFGQVDRLAPIRIKVDENCNSCGHCTAVCTSNVRVSEEVRDYGVVVDAGCMKCMDCVSACPNGALSVGLAMPALFIKPRAPETAALAKQKQRARYDLTLGEEVVFGVVFYLMFFAYRGLYDAVPLLMACGFAAIGAFLVHKCWRLLRDANVRGPFWQLKLSGKLRPVGYAFAAGSLVYIGIGLQGLVMHFGQWQGNMLYDRLEVQRDVVFSPGYVPDPELKSMAQRALAWHRPSRAIGDGGIAFVTTWGENVRASWLAAVAGDLPESERFLRQALGDDSPRTDLALGLIQLMRLRCATPQEIDAQFASFLDRSPDASGIRSAFGDRLLAQGRRQEATALFAKALTLQPRDVDTINAAAMNLLRLNRASDAEQVLRDGLLQRPRSPVLHTSLAQALVIQKRPAEAIEAIAKAIAHTPTSERLLRHADLLAGFKNFQESERLIRQAVALDPTALAVQRLVQVQRAQKITPEVIIPQLIELADRPNTSEVTRQAVAQQLCDLGSPSSAIDLYRRAIVKPKADASTVRNAAELMLLFDKIPDAKTVLVEATTGRFKDRGELFPTLGTVLFALKETDAAKAAFQRGRELMPQQDPMAQLAEDLVRLSRTAELAELYVDAVARSPRHLPTRINAAGLGLTTERFDLVESHAEAGLVVDPCNPTLLDYSGRASFMQGNMERAIARLKAAAEFEPNAERFSNLADLYVRTNQPDLAKAAAGRAAELAPIGQ